ncbi:glycosyl hydrolase family 2 protein [Ructibacterium gallinarum]|uniref:Glycosyl hydrolases family 2, sugar binding domain n=1 Tax=Ructibacterium gallinarum TaxID=2779355 RepID=A0A9D5M4E3_9FIRM|nr:hypothetical protein [Ructibacterium gallinarum]MBE5040499.1 hypothetical protein [Ructibacterium gallinarum]
MFTFDSIKRIDQFNKDEFINPPKENFPIYSWVWNDVLTREKIKDGIEEMNRLNIKGFYIIPIPPEFRPDSMITKLYPPYLSDGFFEYVDYAIEISKKFDMEVWLYDEGGWPSGQASGRVAENIENPYVRLVKLDESDGKIRREYKQNGITDLLNKEVTECFIKLTHNEYVDKLSNINKCSCFFTDEPKTEMPSCTAEFEKIWKKRYKLPLNELYEIVFKKNHTEEEQKYLIAYKLMIGEIFKRNYFESIKKYCNEHDLLSVGHLDRDHVAESAGYLGYGSVISILRTLDIPGIDVIARQIMPGCCVEEKQDTVLRFFPRVASSAAHLNGTNLALSESFSVYGTISYEIMRYVVNYQISRGINLINPMLISYGKSGFLTYAQRPNFSENAPLAHALSQFNMETARKCYMMTRGRTVIHTALLCPVNGLLAGGEYSKNCAAQYKMLGEKLENCGIDFDIIDYDAVREGTLKENQIEIGDMVYTNIYWIDDKFIPEDIMTVLKKVGSDATPLYMSSDGYKNIKVTMRKTATERICFLYNEGGDAVQSRIGIPDIRNAYVCDIQTGEYLSCNTYTENDWSFFDVKLESGESIIVVFTDEKLSYKAEDCTGLIVKIENVNSIGFKRYRLCEDGFATNSGRLHKEYFGEFSFEKYLGKDFSGEVTFSGNFKIPDAKIENAYFVMEQVECCAAVEINNIHIGYALHPPYRIKFDPSILEKGENKVVFTVANSVANEYVYSDNEKNYTEAQLGTYHRMTQGYEQDMISGGIYGDIKIECEIAVKKNEN